MTLALADLSSKILRGINFQVPLVLNLIKYSNSKILRFPRCVSCIYDKEKFRQNVKRIFQFDEISAAIGSKAMLKNFIAKISRLSRENNLQNDSILF